MDDGENNNSSKPIELKLINVDYNISLADAIKLSAEKSGYEAEIRKIDHGTIVDIKIPFLFTQEEDIIVVFIYKGIYLVRTGTLVRKPNTLEEKLAILEYLSDNNGFVSFSWVNRDRGGSILLERRGWRLDKVDKSLAWGNINIEFGNAQVDGNEELVEEKSALRERLSVYMDENLEFNMSGKWNASYGYEYVYILEDINLLLRTVQEESENLLRFT